MVDRLPDVDGCPIPGADLDIGGTANSGLDENTDPRQPDYNLRGRFITDDDGGYELWTVKPVSYPIPDDGPVGDLLRATGRPNMRPAHLPVIASAPGFRTVVTEVYTRHHPWISSDAGVGGKPPPPLEY